MVEKICYLLKCLLSQNLTCEHIILNRKQQMNVWLNAASLNLNVLRQHITHSFLSFEKLNFKIFTEVAIYEVIN